MSSINIGLASDAREGVLRILAALLADEMVLYVKTRNFHWNVSGMHFHQLHAMFESQYDALAETIDQVAERIRALGGHAPGAMSEFTRSARLREHTATPPAARDMVAALAADHETLVRQLRADLAACAEKHGDAGTSDFLTGLMESHEKTAWMLRATATD